MAIYGRFIEYYCSYFKSLTGQKGKYPEVVYRDFVQQHPWGETPQNEWTERGCTYPNGLRLGEGFTRIPISRLSHVTHNKEAGLIRSTVQNQGCYTFKSKQRLGKQYVTDHLPLGETYRHIERRIFSPITPCSLDDPVFPGYYSWWGISVSEWYRLGEGGEDLAGNIRQLRQRVEVSDVLSPEPRSRYGNNAFSIKLSDLLLSYKRSRTDIDERRHVYLRVGGTLRYKWEICYIVIVCLQQDHTLNDLPEIEDANDIIDHNGLINRQGKVVDYWQTPEFKAKYIVTSMKDDRGRYHSFSWEQVVFALYYPSDDLVLQCKEGQIKEGTVDHSDRICISTRNRVCPNNIP